MGIVGKENAEVPRGFISDRGRRKKMSRNQNQQWRKGNETKHDNK